MSTLLTLIIVIICSIFCEVFVVWPSYGLSWLHFPQWLGLVLLGLVLSWLISE
ncbi:MAG: hypothetical protein SWJ54_02410 [Cyanobacteriota bacterium]|nr:hypothetical protein [Cyanobacteriota bacterium]